MVNKILVCLNANGFKAFRMNSGMVKAEGGGMVKLGPTGFSDIFGVIPGGQAFFIEVKKGQNKPTEFQELFLEEMRGIGAVAFWVNSEEEVIKFCSEIVRNRKK